MTFLHLLAAWVRRDFRVRYTQTLFGSLWLLVQPLALTAAFTLLFDGVTQLEVGVPYVVFAYSGMLLWAMVANGLSMAAQSVFSTMYIASKARYPRVVAPLSATLLSVADLVLGLVALPIILALNDVPARLRPLSLVAAFAGSLMLVSGLGALLAALTIFVRDVRNALPFALQFGLLVTPIAYDRADMPPAMADVARWNPIAVFADGWRSGLLGVSAPSGADWLRASSVTALIAVVGFWYFHAVEDRFPDVA